MSGRWTRNHKEVVFKANCSQLFIRSPLYATQFAHMLQNLCQSAAVSHNRFKVGELSQDTASYAFIHHTNRSPQFFSHTYVDTHIYINVYIRSQYSYL